MKATLCKTKMITINKNDPLESLRKGVGRKYTYFLLPTQLYNNHALHKQFQLCHPLTYKCMICISKTP